MPLFWHRQKDRQFPAIKGSQDVISDLISENTLNFRSFEGSAKTCLTYPMARFYDSPTDLEPMVPDDPAQALAGQAV